MKNDKITKTDLIILWILKYIGVPVGIFLAVATVSLFFFLSFKAVMGLL